MADEDGGNDHPRHGDERQVGKRGDSRCRRDRGDGSAAEGAEAERGVQRVEDRLADRALNRDPLSVHGDVESSVGGAGGQGGEEERRRVIGERGQDHGADVERGGGDRGV